MARIDNVKRIKSEDFPPKDQETISRLAEVYNFFAEQVTNAINGNLDFENLTEDVFTFEVTVDSNGSPIDNSRFASSIGLQGTTVINAANLTNPAVYATQTPFISWSSNGAGIYTINNISGLPANNKFRLTIRLT